MPKYKSKSYLNVGKIKKVKERFIDTKNTFLIQDMEYFSRGKSDIEKLDIAKRILKQYYYSKNEELLRLPAILESLVVIIKYTKEPFLQYIDYALKNFIIGMSSLVDDFWGMMITQAGEKAESWIQKGDIYWDVKEGKVRDMLKRWGSLPRSEKVILFERLRNALHKNGDMLRWWFIAYDERYGEEREIFDDVEVSRFMNYLDNL